MAYPKSYSLPYTVCPAMERRRRLEGAAVSARRQRQALARLNSTAAPGTRHYRRAGRRGVLRSSVQRKVRELQRLVPGGRRLRTEQLFMRTADYIFQLRFQVHALKALSELYMA